MKFICNLVAIGMLLLQSSCVRPDNESQRKQPSVEERVAEMEKFRNNNVRQVSPELVKKQYESDLAEIQRLGLVERAKDDIRSHLGNVVVKSWTFAYFFNTNMVWCDLRYSVLGQDQIRQKEFGYERRGTNWNLLWDPGSRP